MDTKNNEVQYGEGRFSRSVKRFIRKHPVISVAAITTAALSGAIGTDIGASKLTQKNIPLDQQPLGQLITEAQELNPNQTYRALAHELTGIKDFQGHQVEVAFEDSQGRAPSFQLNENQRIKSNMQDGQNKQQLWGDFNDIQGIFVRMNDFMVPNSAMTYDVAIKYARPSKIVNPTLDDFSKNKEFIELSINTSDTQNVVVFFRPYDTNDGVNVQESESSGVRQYVIEVSSTSDHFPKTPQEIPNADSYVYNAILPSFSTLGEAINSVSHNRDPFAVASYLQQVSPLLIPGTT